MDTMAYWKRQSDKKPLFAEIDTERPEQKYQAGRLLVVGGNKMSFFAASSALGKAVETGIGEVKVLLPDSLKAKVPLSPDVIFSPSEASGGFGKDAVRFAVAAAENTDYVLMIGDMGKNSETTTFAEKFMVECDKSVLITRDAVDLVTTAAAEWLNRNVTTLCATLPQLQKVFRAVYYPKMITLSMPMNQLAETLHKFTVTYPILIVTYHEGQVVVAKDGEVVTTALADTGYSPISLWAGDLAVKIVAMQLWNGGKNFESAVTAILG